MDRRCARREIAGSQSEIPPSRDGAITGNTNTIDDDCLAPRASDSDADGVSAESTAILKKVVILTSGSLPCLPAVGRDFELGDRLV